MSAWRARAMVGSETMKMRDAKPVRNWPMTALARRSRSVPGIGAPYHEGHPRCPSRTPAREHRALHLARLSWRPRALDGSAHDDTSEAVFPSRGNTAGAGRAGRLSRGWAGAPRGSGSRGLASRAPPEALARKGHLGDLDARRTERIDHRVGDGRRRREGAALPGALDPERVERRRGHHVVNVQGRDVRCAGQRVVHQRARRSWPEAS